ncbi:DNA-binding transcriptional regulator YiaG [Oxalobacteraceae bacterium GrIS 2.11]
MRTKFTQLNVMSRKPRNTYNNSEVFQQIADRASLAGLDQLNQISQHMGISPTLLADIKYGSCSLKQSHRKTVEKIANYLGVDVNQVYRWSGENIRKPVPELSKTARYVTYMREKLEMNKRDAAAYFGLGKNAFIDYELDKREPSLLLLLVLKVLEDHPELFRNVNALISNPDPRQAHPTYFSFMRRKLKLRKRDAAALLGLGKGTFTQIEYGSRQPSTLLLIMFKLLEIRPELFHEVRQLSASAAKA